MISSAVFFFFYLFAVVENGFDDEDLYDELTSADADDCMLLSFDENFPLKKPILNEIKKYREIQRILRHIYEHNELPSLDPPVPKTKHSSKYSVCYSFFM